MLRKSAAVFTAALFFLWAPSRASSDPVPTGPTVHHRVPAAAVRHAGRATAGYDWQAMGHDASHDAYENDSKMSAAIAPTLGVNWMTNMLSPDVGGPTAAQNPRFGVTAAYTGDEMGDLAAFDESNGHPLWSALLGLDDAIYSTPLISSDLGSAWVGTAYGSRLYKVDTATGAVTCSIPEGLPVQASATEGAASNGSEQVFIETIDNPTQGGPLQAYDESTCRLDFASNPYRTPNSGAWASPSYGVDAAGRRLAFVGTADPDSTEYAIDATTGALDWYFVTDQVGDNDIGAASTVSPPGYNGFADGVLYVIGKNQVCYAVDLTTGALIWSYNFAKDRGPGTANARSAAALDGARIVFGMGNGVYSLNAITGAKLWHYVDPTHTEVISNPAIVGPPGNEVVAFGDLSGAFHVLALSNGSQLYSYQTGDYITASPAYVNGHFLIASTDGFLYDFGAGGGTGAHPATAITSPGPGSKLPYAPSVTVRGSATSASGVAGVQFAVQQNGATGPWFDAVHQRWSKGAVTNFLAVASPGATQTAWSATIPAPANGTTLRIIANAVGTNHLADIGGAQVAFSVGASTTQPQLATSSGFVAPKSRFTANGSGFDAGEKIEFALDTLKLGSAITDRNGDVSATLTIPGRALFGITPLTATGSGQSAFAPIDVTNAWLQWADGPAHTSFEANDASFSRLIAPGGNMFLQIAWYFDSGAPVESSPSVLEGVTYFGNDAGTLTAVNTASAAPAWSMTIPSSAAIRSTPAVDPSTSDIVFTADDGNLYVVAAASGTPVASAHIGGLLTSPTVHAGTVYVGSDNGTVVSVNELTGAVNWTATFPAAVHSVPSLDYANHRLVAGDDAGGISALDSSTGAFLWNVSTGGPVTATPALANGIVYACSTDGNLYAITESAGSPIWTYAAQTPLTVGAVYDQSAALVYAGGADGTVFAVAAATGKTAWTTVSKYGHSAIVGLSAVAEFVFAENSAGSVVTFKSTQFGRFNSSHPTAAGLTTTPTVNDGALYIGANDGGVYAFTPYGGIPTLRGGMPQMRTGAARYRGSAALSRRPGLRFDFAGQREAGIRIDAVRGGLAAVTRRPAGRPGGPASAARTYLIFWQPPAARFERRYPAALFAALSTGAARLAGSLAATLDTAPYPPAMSDRAIRAEIDRVRSQNRWRAGADARFIVLTADAAAMANPGFCAYHSAYRPDREPATAAVYAVVPFSGAMAACGAWPLAARSGDPAIDAATVNVARVASEMDREPLPPAAARSGLRDAAHRLPNDVQR